VTGCKPPCPYSNGLCSSTVERKAKFNTPTRHRTTCTIVIRCWVGQRFTGSRSSTSNWTDLRSQMCISHRHCLWMYSQRRHCLQQPTDCNYVLKPPGNIAPVESQTSTIRPMPGCSPSSHHCNIVCCDQRAPCRVLLDQIKQEKVLTAGFFTFFHICKCTLSRQLSDNKAVPSDRSKVHLCSLEPIST